MEATKDNNPFQFGGMTPNIWIEKTLRELLMALQTGTIFILLLALEDIPSLMYTSNKLFPGVIDTISSAKKPEITPFPEIWIGCLAVNDDEVFICLHDIYEVECSALLVLTA
jgi:hypothetical protein